MVQNTTLVKSLWDLAAKKDGHAAANILAERRCVDAVNHLQQAHLSISKVFTDPSIVVQPSMVSLELVRRLWGAFASGQHRVLEAKGAAEDLAPLVSPEAVEAVKAAVLIPPGSVYGRMDLNNLLAKASAEQQAAPKEDARGEHGVFGSREARADRMKYIQFRKRE